MSHLALINKPFACCHSSIKQRKLLSFQYFCAISSEYIFYFLIKQAQREEKIVRFAPEPEMEEIEIASEVT